MVGVRVTVGVGVRVKVGVVVGVNVGAGVEVDVAVAVAVGVGVQADAVAVKISAIRVACCSGDDPQDANPRAKRISKSLEMCIEAFRGGIVFLRGYTLSWIIIMTLWICLNNFINSG